jgi:biotin carboxyl carrier protein
MNPPMKRGTAVVAGERVEFLWNRSAGMVEAKVAERAYTLETRELSPGTYWFCWNGLSLEATVTAVNQGYAVSVRGHHIDVELLDARKALRRASQADHQGILELRAPMPGKVVRVLVAEGGEVSARQGIIVMEAMKMQNEIRTPKQGRIQRLAVKEGDAVSSNDLIALIE